MITRSEYMENSIEFHHDYYSQFVTPETLNFVRNHIGMDKIKASKDHYLNDVVKWEQGGLTWAWDRSPINVEYAKECGECVNNPTPSTCTCVGKAAARMLLKQES